MPTILPEAPTVDEDVKRGYLWCGRQEWDLRGLFHTMCNEVQMKIWSVMFSKSPTILFIFIIYWLVCWIWGSYYKACCSLSQRLSELVGEIFEAASDLQREHMDAWWETAASLAKCSTLPPTARWKTFTSYFMCISLTRGNILLLCWSALIPQRLLTGIICWQGRSFAPLTYRALFFPKND